MCCTLQMLGFDQISVEPVVGADTEEYALQAGGSSEDLGSSMTSWQQRW